MNPNTAFRLPAALACLLLAACNPYGGSGFAVTAIATPAGPGSAEPHLASGPSGQQVMSWLEPGQGGTQLRFATLEDGRWTPARTVAAGEDWFVNWADFPSVSPVSDTTWAAHWLVKRPGGTYAYDVVVSVSTDAGASWGMPVTPHDDGTPTEHGFVSLFPWKSGVGALWLDGRNMQADGHGGHEAHGAGDPATGMTLRSAVILADGSVTDSRLVDGLVCDCCQTDVAIAASGPIAAYRDRSVGEIRDIYVARAIDGEWQPGQPVFDDGWQIAGCPVNGPAIAASSNDVAVAWFTAPGNQPRVRFARSADGGATFSAPLDIELHGAAGRVDVELLDGGDSVVSWLVESGNGQGELRLQRIGRDGRAGPVRVVAPLSTARRSGFPQMTRHGDGLLLAWTDASGEATVVRTALVSGF